MINIREKVESFLDKTSSYMLSGKRKQKTTLCRLNYFKLYLIFQIKVKKNHLNIFFNEPFKMTLLEMIIMMSIKDDYKMIDSPS
jgi:hypothetical protein